MRHGRRRGPVTRLAAFRPGFFDPLLDEFARHAPDLRAGIDLWETGTPLPDLSHTAAVVFLLADPLRELYPDCYREAEELARKAAALGIRVVNPPAALSNTVKSRQAELLLRAGVPTPRHLRFDNRDELAAAVGQTAFPAIIRADLLHAQTQMIFCRMPEEALAIAPGKLPLPGSIAEFVDTREGFRATEPGSLYAEYYHKKRAFVFGGHVVNNHVFFGSRPIVGGKSSTFGHYRSLNPIRRYLRNAQCRDHCEADYRFFLQGESNAGMLLRASRALNLEFVAIDYSSKSDGSIVVWELNPHFCMYPWPFQVLARQRRLGERYRKFHAVIGEFFRELQEGKR